MEHQAFAQLLGNYGEFVGAIAVVITLVYLSMQIRSSAKATESQVHASLSSETEMVFVALSTDEALADAMLAAQAQEELTPKQRLKLNAWFSSFLRVCESHVLQRRLNATSINLEVPVANNLRDFATVRELRRIMENAVAGNRHTTEFLSFLESEVLAKATKGDQSF